jgi:hypothetical protein
MSAPSQDPAPTPIPRPQPQRGFNIPKAQHTEAGLNATVACENPSSATCPSAIGMMLTKYKNWMGQCTAFLIDDQLLMTNSHCLPENLKIDGTDCRAHIQVFFPKTNDEPAESAICERVLRASKVFSSKSPIMERTTDYALLKLTRPLNRKPFKLSRAGLEDKMKLVFYSVEPQSLTEVRGLIRTRRCVTIQASVAAPSFIQPFADVASVVDCQFPNKTPGPFVHGNSGSPGIDPSGHVHVISQGIVEPLPGVNNKPSKFKQVGIVTNIACTELPESAGSLGATANAGCRKRLTPKQLLEELLTKSDDRLLQPLADTWLKNDAPKELGFRVERVESKKSRNRLIVPSVNCVNAPKGWATSEELKRQAVVLRFAIPFWGFLNDQDEYLRITLTPAISSVEEETLTMDLREVQKKNWAFATLSLRSQRTGQTQTFADFHLPVCKAK